MKDQPQHQHDENEAVDVEVKALVRDGVHLVEDAHQHQKHGQEPGVLEPGGESALPRAGGAPTSSWASEQLRIDALHLRSPAAP